MITKEQADKFRQCIVAQDDDCDYSESGWVAVVDGDWAALSRYGHCSCYDTWSDMTSDGTCDPIWDWEGTADGLIELAKYKLDPAIPQRVSQPDDYDYDHLMNVYDQILKWNERRN